MKTKYFTFLSVFFISLSAFGDCQVLTSSGSPATKLSDALFTNLKTQSHCPANVFELKGILSKDGLSSSPTMVANRGRHNPRFGSFSLFETVSGHSKTLQRTLNNDELYFGHFTGAQNGTVDVDQSSRPGKLLIELIAWDPNKEVYNFYELIGNSPQPIWFYRGDSTDALKDNQLLHRQTDSNRPKFGQRMRCSGCHSSGGPIMKELKPPHNDWWTNTRHLPFGQNHPSENLKLWLTQLVDAEEFSKSVRSGIKKLQTSKKFQDFKRKSSLQEQLRPLFCTSEINLISDEKPLDSPITSLQVPSNYWANPLLSPTSKVAVKKGDYLQIIDELRFQFPETRQRDADHGWLAPVKGHSDLEAIQSLIEQKIVDEEFVADVLAIDFTNPLFSKERCSLLQLLPTTTGSHWKKLLITNLETSNLPGAQELLSHLTDRQKTREFHQRQAKDYLKRIIVSIKSKETLKEEILRLQSKRLSVFENEISKNPLGQILEPGFRVIFPMTR